MIWAITAMLLLQPVLEADTQLRLVATGADRVEWHLDGQRVAVTEGSAPAEITVTAGEHELWAVTGWEGDWSVLARPDNVSAAGAQYVPSWSASASGAKEPFDPFPWLIGLVGLTLLIGRVTPKRP